MLDRLDAFRSDKITLDKLVVGLDGLLNALENVDSNWKQDFLHEWGKLEDERAYAAFAGLESFDEEARQRLQAAGDQLATLVRTKIRH